jgi:uncharacterized protein (DUF2126 family)
MEKRRFIAKEGNTKFTFHDAEKFATELTKYLGIDTKNVTNLRRSYLLGIRGRKLPVNLDPLKVNLKDSVERHKLAMLLEKGLNNPAGFVLPMKGLCC